MMKNIVKLTAFAVLLLSAGCATSVCRHYPAQEAQKTASGKIVVAEIRGMNYGYFLFNSIPVWCGAPHYPNDSEWRVWRNLVRERDIRRMLTARAKKIGADDIENLKIRENSSGFWSLWILWYRSVDGECLAVKTPRKVKTQKAKRSALPF